MRSHADCSTDNVHTGGAQGVQDPPQYFFETVKWISFEAEETMAKTRAEVAEEGIAAAAAALVLLPLRHLQQLMIGLLLALDAFVFGRNNQPSELVST